MKKKTKSQVFEDIIVTLLCIFRDVVGEKPLIHFARKPDSAKVDFICSCISFYIKVTLSGLSREVKTLNYLVLKTDHNSS